MAKKIKRTRLQEFRSKRNRSWTKFLLTIVAFSLFVGALTGAIIIAVLGWGDEVPLLYVGFEKATSVEGRLEVTSVEPRSFPKEIAFGGPDKDTLIVFAKIVGSTRVEGTESDAEVTPVVFVPPTDQKFFTHQYAGLLEGQTEEQVSAWERFDDYVVKMLKPLEGKEGNFLLVLDVQHPETPAGQLPHQDRFIERVQELWQGSLQKDLKEKHSNIELAIWLSHNPVQNNYFHPDPNAVGSLFQKAFDEGLGDSEAKTYQDLKQKVRTRVLSDAWLFLVAQEPLFLEEEDSFNFRLASAGEVEKDKTVFTYPKRVSENNLDDWWQKFDRVRRAYDWELENPLAWQRANLLLMQMERLWYAGLADKQSYNALDRRLRDLLSPNKSVGPAIHSLYDRKRDHDRNHEKNLEVPKFDLSWFVDDAPNDEGSQESEDAEPAGPTELEKWKTKNNDWIGTLAMWQALVQSGSGNFNQRTLQRFMDELPESNVTLSPEDVNGPEVYWSEIGYVRRLTDELLWAEKSDKEATATETLVKRSVQLRDLSNRFASSLSPVLVDLFRDDFEKLENLRRSLEDRLFAADFAGLESEFKKLQSDLTQLWEKHEKLKEELRRRNRNLIVAPHWMRYCQESHIVKQQFGQEAVEQSAITAFEEAWEKLHSVKLQGNDDANALVKANAVFEEAQSKLLPDHSELHAGSPLRDKARLNISEGLKKQDANLYARRLLFWPGLKPTTRKSLHKDLSTDWPKPSEDKKSTEEFASVPILGSSGIMRASMLSKSDRTLDFGKHLNHLDILNDAAFRGHLAYVKVEDEPAKTIADLLSRAHADRSDVEFARIANDNWGTLFNKEPLGLLALESHERQIRQFAAPVKEEWQTKIEAWKKTIGETQEFAKDFQNSELWPSKLSQSQQLIPQRQVLEYSKRQATEGDLTTLRVRSKEKDPIACRWENDGWNCAETLTYERTLYLRGHKYKHTFDRLEQAPSNDVVKVKLDGDAVGGAKINIARSVEKKAIGQITFVIDCSYSMKGGKIKQLRKSLTNFLESISEREDIKVSMFAIGATRNAKKQDQDTIFPTKSLSEWTFLGNNHTDDVVAFNGNGAVIDADNQTQFVSAVERLEEFGQTPILQGLKRAIDETDSAEDNLIVLLTDGFEYTTSEDHTSENKFNTTLYNSLQQRINSRDDLEVTEFDFFSGDLKSDFKSWKGRLKVGLTGLDEIKDRIDRVNRLSNFRARADSTNLTQYLSRLLPAAEVVLRGDQGEIDRISIDPKKRTGSIGSFDVPVSELTEMKRGWSVGVEFKRQSRGLNVFARKNAKWDTNLALAGNEKLDFVYDPSGPKLTLNSDNRDNKSREVKLHGQQVKVEKVTINERQLNFDLSAVRSDTLTPFPAIAFMTIESPNGKSVLVQDFNLRQQTSSNVHQLAFPEIRDDVRVTLLDGEPTTTLWLSDSVPADFWTTLTVDRDKNEVVSNSGNESVTLRQTTFESIDHLLPKSDEGYSFKMNYKPGVKTGPTYTIQISCDSDRPVPLDRWIVQLIAPSSRQVDHRLKCNSQRKFSLNAGKLFEVEHQLKIDRNGFQTYAPVTIGIGYLGAKDKFLPDRFQKIEVK